MSDSGNNYPMAPFGQSMDNYGLATDLTGFDRKVVKDDKDRLPLRKLYLTLTKFVDDNEATAYASAMHKCMKAGLWDELEELVLRCYAKVSVNARGRDDIIDVLTQFQAIKEQSGNDNRKSARKPQRANV